MTPRRLAVLLATAVLVQGVVPAASAAAARRSTPEAPRAMWVWDRPGVSSLVRFADRRGVEDLFVSAPGELATSPDLPWFRSLRRRAASAQVRVHALGAEVAWLDDHKAALTWQRQVLDTGLFDGIHLDVEPWQHRGWGADPDGLLSSWTRLLERLSSDTSRPVEADISFWLHEHIVDGRPADEAVMDSVDAVTVMSYRDRATGPDSITGISTTALATAARLGTPVRLAVETRHLGDDPVSEKQTFAGATQRQLDGALAEVDAFVADHPSYAGISVHDHDGWAALRP